MNKELIIHIKRFLSDIGLCCLYLLSFLFIPLSSCSTDDYRDECCDNLIINFRYSKGGNDVFTDNIHSMTHYLFNSSGILENVFIGGTANNLQRLVINNLFVGKYSLISLGNLGASTNLSNIKRGLTNKSDFLLGLNSSRSDGFMGNGDMLYWGVLDFEVKKSKSLRYLCDMSNIHCIMNITVKWRDEAPNGDDSYILELQDVPGEYSLDNDNAYKIHLSGDNSSNVSAQDRVIHSFPKVNEVSNIVSHRLEAKYIAGSVKSRFISLRYTKNRIPILRIYHKGMALTNGLALSKVFYTWKWETDANIEQVYNIDVEILGDGSVMISPGANASVKDWIDGGSVN